MDKLIGRREGKRKGKSDGHMDFSIDYCGLARITGLHPTQIWNIYLSETYLPGWQWR